MEFLNDIFLTLLLALATGLTAAVVMRGLYVAFKRSAASFSKNIGGRLLFKSALVLLFSAIAFTGAYMTQAEKRKSGNGEWGTGNGEWGTAYWGNISPEAKGRSRRSRAQCGVASRPFRTGSGQWNPDHLFCRLHKLCRNRNAYRSRCCSPRLIYSRLREIRRFNCERMDERRIFNRSARYDESQF